MRFATKRLLSLALAMLMLIGAAPLATAAATPYYDWKQYDPRWASAVLTTKTMKQVGCLATTVAILAVQAGLRSQEDFDPGVFAADMRRAGGFNADDDLLWEALPKAVPGLTAQAAWESLRGTREEKTAKLGKYLEQGYQVAVAVKGGGHWVALRSVADGRAVMMDPGSSATDLFAKYPAAGVTRVALLRADTPNEPQPKPIQPKEEISMADSIFAFLQDVGNLFLAIFKYILFLAK